MQCDHHIGPQPFMTQIAWFNALALSLPVVSVVICGISWSSSGSSNRPEMFLERAERLEEPEFLFTTILSCGVRSFQSAKSHLHRVSTELQVARSLFPEWQYDSAQELSISIADTDWPKMQRGA